MRRVMTALALLGAALAAACSAVDPYATFPAIAQMGQPTGARVGICYNTLATTLAEVKAQAQRECAAGTLAQPVDTDWYLQYCPLLLPARATFACTPARK